MYSKTTAPEVLCWSPLNSNSKGYQAIFLLSFVHPPFPLIPLLDNGYLSSRSISFFSLCVGIGFANILDGGGFGPIPTTVQTKWSSLQILVLCWSPSSQTPFSYIYTALCFSLRHYVIASSRHSTNFVITSLRHLTKFWSGKRKLGFCFVDFLLYSKKDMLF